MTTSQQFEAFLPLYDAIPEKWEDGRAFLVEALKKISGLVNTAEIGWFIDQEVVSGKQFIPGVNNDQLYRTVFRQVYSCGPLSIGANTVAHGIPFDVNFTLLDLWVSATNSTTFNAITMSDPSNVTMDATNININSPAAFDRAFAVCEYILEL